MHAGEGVNVHGLARRADLGPEPTPTNSHLAKTMLPTFVAISIAYVPNSAPQSSQLLGMTFDWMKPGTMTVWDLIRPL